MSWSAEDQFSKRSATPGFVVDDALIDTWIEWNEGQNKFVFKNIENAEWWEIDQK